MNQSEISVNKDTSMLKDSLQISSEPAEALIVEITDRIRYFCMYPRIAMINTHAVLEQFNGQIEILSKRIGRVSVNLFENLATKSAKSTRNDGHHS